MLEPSEDVELAPVANPPAGTLERLPRLKFLQALWMGVERLLADSALPKHVSLARLIDPGEVAAMTESVLAHVLDWHRHHYRYRAQQAARRWEQLPQVHGFRPQCRRARSGRTRRRHVPADFDVAGLLSAAARGAWALTPPLTVPR